MVLCLYRLGEKLIPPSIFSTNISFGATKIEVQYKE